MIDLDKVLTPEEFEDLLRYAPLHEDEAEFDEQCVACRLVAEREAWIELVADLRAAIRMEYPIREIDGPVTYACIQADQVLARARGTA